MALWQPCLSGLSTVNDEESLNELVVLMKVLDILKLRIETREIHNYESVQITQIANQFLPGTTIGNFIQDRGIENGDTTMGDKYEVHGHAQVGAMGKGAKVTTLTFSGPSGTSEIDVAALVAELKSLRSEMRNQATTTEDDEAVVAVGQAISAAEDGDVAGLTKYLKIAGKWAMGIASSVGAGVAVAAIKSALGL